MEPINWNYLAYLALAEERKWTNSTVIPGSELYCRFCWCAISGCALVVHLGMGYPNAESTAYPTYLSLSEKYAIGFTADALQQRLTVDEATHLLSDEAGIRHKPTGFGAAYTDKDFQLTEAERAQYLLWFNEYQQQYGALA